MQYKNIFKKIIQVVLMSIFLLNAHHAFAASIIAVPEKDFGSIHENIQVDVVLNSDNQQVNAISGSLIFDPKLLSVKDITIGGSVVNFWVDQPRAGDLGMLYFSGIIPGGINAVDARLFSVIFSAMARGEGSLFVRDPLVFINDGNGTKLNTVSPQQTITINSSDIVPKSNEITDTTAPEKFTITRAKDENIFDGKWFIVFSAQDKGSGVASYQVCESLFKKCVDTKSPVLLSQQKSFYHVWVKAYDQHNNIRYSFLIAPQVIVLWLLIFISCILLIIYVAHRTIRKKIIR